MAAGLVMLSTVSSAARLDGTASKTAQLLSASDGRPLSDVVSPPPSVIVDNREVEGVVGKEVRSVADENMGRIIEVIVDRTGQVRAAVIDFGGFLGVGNRKIAVDWNKLRFASAGDRQGRIILELTKDQVRAAPDYKDGKPVVILGALDDPRVPYPSAAEW